jgi:hypothetical protein
MTRKAGHSLVEFVPSLSVMGSQLSFILYFSTSLVNNALTMSFSVASVQGATLSVKFVIPVLVTQVFTLLLALSGTLYLMGGPFFPAECLGFPLGVAQQL